MQAVQVLAELFPARGRVLLTSQMLTLCPRWLLSTAHATGERAHRATLVLVTSWVNLTIVRVLCLAQAGAALASLSEAIGHAFHGDDLGFCAADLIRLERVVQRHTRPIRHDVRQHDARATGLRGKSSWALLTGANMMRRLRRVVIAVLERRQRLLRYELGVTRVRSHRLLDEQLLVAARAYIVGRLFIAIFA